MLQVQIKDLIVTLSNVDNIKSQANVSALEHLLKPKDDCNV